MKKYFAWIQHFLLFDLMSLQIGSDNEVSESGFSFAPYIIGGIIPRCFDTSKHVQLTAIDSLHIILRYFTNFDGFVV